MATNLNPGADASLVVAAARAGLAGFHAKARRPSLCQDSECGNLVASR